MQNLKILLCGGRRLSDAVWAINRGFEALGCETRHIPTRRAGTKYEPIENIEATFADVVQDWKPDVLLWVMCKFDCPPGLIAMLRKLRPEMRTVFHSFDDPQQIDATGTPWADEYEYAITCCVGSIAWYEQKGIRAICLYPPADRELHGGAEPAKEHMCDFSFAATNVYARQLYPKVLVERVDVARIAHTHGKLHLYGPWEGTRSTWGSPVFGAPELIECAKGRRPWEEMPRIYKSSAININSHNRPEAYQYFNERVIHSVASGGFMLVDRVAGLEEVFKPGVHLDTWETLEEFEDKLQYWLKHPERREKVARSGQQFMLEHFDSVAHNHKLLDFLGLADRASAPVPAAPTPPTAPGKKVDVSADPRSLLKSAEAAAKAGKQEEAEAIVGLVRRSSLGPLEQALGVARLRMTGRQFDAAKRESLAALKMAEQARLESLRLLGAACTERREHKDAALYLRLAYEQTRHAGDAQKLGAALVRAGESEAALPLLQEALRAGPANATTYHHLGNAYSHLRRYDEAIAAYQNALKLDPLRTDCIRETGLAFFRSGRYAESLPFSERMLLLDPKKVRSYLELARAQAAAGNPEAAETCLRKGVEVCGSDPDLNMELGRLSARKGDRLAALDLFRQVLAAQPDNHKAALEVIRQALSARQFGLAKEVADALILRHPDNPETLFEFGRVCLDTAQPDRAREAFQAALAGKPELHQAHYRLAQISLRENNVAAAVGSMDHAIALDPQRVSYRIDRARLHLALNHFAAARADAEAALAVEPKNPKAAQIVSLVRDMADEQPVVRIAAAFHAEPGDLPGLAATLATIPAPHEAWVSPLGDDTAAAPGLRLLPTGRDLLEPALAEASDADWMLVAPAASAPAVAARLADPALEGALRSVERIYGRAVFTDAAGLPVLTLLRRELLNLFGDMAEIERRPVRALVEEHEEVLRTVTLAPDGALHRLPAPKGLQDGHREGVFLISRHGFELYGGGEQFLRGMAGIYRGEGFEPTIIGMRNDTPGVVEGEENGQRFAQLRPLPGDIFAYTLRKRPRLVQVLSGLGYEVLTPLKYLHVGTVYGTHYWRDMFEEIGGYLNIDQTAVPKREFNAILQQATVVYSNSHYTAEMKRKHFGVNTPLVYSLTADAEVPPVTGGEYALLVNARPEKGFDLILEVAKRVPHIPFLVLASQSPVAQAEEAASRAGVTNITVTGKVSDMREAYARAKVVLVPSYAFIETFSRVVIEAHRLGLPVVGSDRGNVPYLLAEAGTALPEDAEAWAAELDRLFTDPAYYGQRVRLALENSERYAFAGQPERIRRIVDFSAKRILVAVGAGLGNIVQTSPLIRRLAEHYGRPVDVVVKEDFKGCSVLVAGAPWVNMVFPLDRNVVRREYDLVYVTHSFGDIIPSFNANTVIAARRHFVFQMTKDMHEAEFNLFCAEKLLGVPFEKADAAKYFVADAHRATIPNGLIGIHSGGKGGEWEEGSWLNKRWPYYKDLVKALQVQGYKVASFGVGSEYVEGTIDLTGTPLMESVRNIAACSYFIGNDSGLMHIADGLGVPLTTIFGPTSVVKNGPLAPTSSVIELKKDCAPCQFDERFATCTCIAAVGLGPVLEHVLRHMARAAGPAGERAYTELETLPLPV
ncbi:glycosyltransferase family protein [Roseomonas populi]|uniref:Tetratricopeptide repeat protein n=1 Tax=Roseomonas populi TaxID=3121582 RepID=A0ABT1XBQ6_9PROT|nr:tetratricopeptide repeat protein [Roseomonas pecuniae]MCR0985556.1 tetratricopeptide repeat protein [Roseomonas pecuniae]